MSDSLAGILGFFMDIISNIWIYLAIGFWVGHRIARKQKKEKLEITFFTLAIIFTIITILAACAPHILQFYLYHIRRVILGF